MKTVAFVELASIISLTLMLTGCNSTGRGSSGGSTTGSAYGVNQTDPIFPQSTERMNDKRPDQPGAPDSAPLR